MKRRILSALLISVLALGAIFGLTACKMSEKKFYETVSEMAKNYYANHVDADKFADTTVTYTLNEKSETPNAEFDDKMDVYESTETVKVATKKIGEYQTLYVEENVVTTRNYYVDDGDGAAVAKTDRSVVTTKNVYGYYTVDEDVVFYLTEEVTSKYNDNEATTEKSIYEFYNEDSYKYYLDYNLENVNNLIAPAFVGIDEYSNLELGRYGAEVNIEKDGDIITYEYDYGYDEYGWRARNYDLDFAATFDLNGVNKIVRTRTTTYSNGGYSTQDLELNVAYSADYSIVTDPASFADYDYEYVDEWVVPEI